MCLEVSGDFACFTRPELSVERVSYDFITPSSARAIYSAIFWKPAIRWRIRRIDVLSPVKYHYICRNELDKVGVCSSIEEHRQIRNSVILKDVKYRIHADMEFINPEDRIGDTQCAFRTDESPGKYLAIFERRASKGQCFKTPYFGCREFTCDFELVDSKSSFNAPEELKGTKDYGFVLYDIDYDNGNTPQYYRAIMVNGIVQVPGERVYS
jgi:CRISPR-associated protein Cas5d